MAGSTTLTQVGVHVICVRVSRSTCVRVGVVRDVSAVDHRPVLPGSGRVVQVLLNYISKMAGSKGCKS